MVCRYAGGGPLHVVGRLLGPDESAGSAFELLGGAVNLGSSSSSDTDILYDFIQSQEMVDRINARVDLRELWAKGDPERDPVFSYHPPGTIEDMVTYWNRMVSIYNDTSTGIMDLEVQAFTPRMPGFWRR